MTMIKKGYLLHDHGGEIEVEEVEILAQWGDEVVINSSAKAIWSSVGGVYEPKSRNTGVKGVRSLTPQTYMFSSTHSKYMLTTADV